MSLEIGARIGPYEVTGQLGAGGMGEVYRATDRNLNRDVAIKVLPEVFAEDPERLARFEREAQLLASLNHPNIGGIYGLEEADGSRCLILELVEGRTLAEVIDQGAVELEAAVRLALQIAEALEAAHEKGIIHRDLKPANIKVTPDGAVKVLDFGLAKAYSDDGPGSAPEPAHSPTLTMAATQAGVILGTAAYMSPEQAAGQAADRRSDIWSFGVVLLEMLTGHRSFSGETVSHTLAAVLKDDPEWGRLPDDLPPRLMELLRSCLCKKPRHRLQAIGDARIVLEAWLADPAAFAPPAPIEPAPAAVEVSSSSRAPWIVAGVLAAALIAAVALLWPKTPAPLPPVQSNLALPDGQGLFRGYGSSIALSPDGSRLAYVVTVRGEGRTLFVRALDQWDGIRLAPDLEAYHPFFSPDGTWIGFVTRQSMYKVPVRGGSPIKLTDVELNRGASWGEDGLIIFARTPASGLYRVSEAGGEPESLTEVAERETHRWPQILPGGKAVLFTSASGDSETFDDAQIELLILESGERRVLHRGGTYARYVESGHLVFAGGSSLFAAPFDVDSLTMTGSIVPVLEGVSTDPSQGGAQYDVSSTGRLVFAREGRSDIGYQLVRVSRSGDRAPLAEDRRAFANPELSPDQKLLAVEIDVEGKSDVWVYDLERGLPTRITSGVGSHEGPIWSPDGEWVYYAVSDSGTNRIERIAADGSGEPETLLEANAGARPLSVSPDGRELIFREASAGGPELRRWSRETGVAEAFVETPAIDYAARFSPDGRWIAYGTNESGTFEVFVVPSAGGRGRWQVSNGGIYPHWSADGSAIFYRGTEDGLVYEVPIQAGTGNIRAGRPRVAVGEGPYRFINGADNDYAVAADGQSFIMLEEQVGTQETHEHVNLVLGWHDALRSIAK